MDADKQVRVSPETWARLDKARCEISVRFGRNVSLATAIEGLMFLSGYDSAVRVPDPSGKISAPERRKRTRKPIAEISE